MTAHLIIRLGDCHFYINKKRLREIKEMTNLGFLYRRKEKLPNPNVQIQNKNSQTNA